MCQDIKPIHDTATGLFQTTQDPSLRDTMLESWSFPVPYGTDNMAVFLYGHCGVFALALASAYNATIAVLPDEYPTNDPMESIIHAYTIVPHDDGTKTRADVRGATDDSNAFFGPFEDCLDQPIQEKTIHDLTAARATLERYMGHDTFLVYYDVAETFIKAHKDWFDTVLNT